MAFSAGQPSRVRVWAANQRMHPISRAILCELPISGRAQLEAAWDTGGAATAVMGAVVRKGRGVMAEPGADVAVRGAAPVEGSVAKSDPDLLVAQIERTREDLARTIDSLAERVSLPTTSVCCREKVAAQVARPEVQMGARPPSVLAVAGSDDRAHLGAAAAQAAANGLKLSRRCFEPDVVGALD